jgi:hypothetical protein
MRGTGCPCAAPGAHARHRVLMLSAARPGRASSQRPRPAISVHETRGCGGFCHAGRRPGRRRPLGVHETFGCGGFCPAGGRPGRRRPLGVHETFGCVVFVLPEAGSDAPHPARPDAPHPARPDARHPARPDAPARPGLPRPGPARLERPRPTRTPPTRPDRTPPDPARPGRPPPGPTRTPRPDPARPGRRALARRSRSAAAEGAVLAVEDRHPAGVEVLEQRDRVAAGRAPGLLGLGGGERALPLGQRLEPSNRLPDR